MPINNPSPIALKFVDSFSRAPSCFSFPLYAKVMPFPFSLLSQFFLCLPNHNANLHDPVSVCKCLQAKYAPFYTSLDFLNDLAFLQRGEHTKALLILGKKTIPHSEHSFRCLLPLPELGCNKQCLPHPTASVIFGRQLQNAAASSSPMPSIIFTKPNSSTIK